MTDNETQLERWALRREEYRREGEVLFGELDALVGAAREAGVSVARIAELLGVSRQRVYARLDKRRGDNETPCEPPAK